MLVNGEYYTVVGVAPPDFFGTTVGLRPALYVPMMIMMDKANPGSSVFRSRNALGLELLGRLAPGVEIEAAEARLRTVTANLSAAFPEIHEGHDLEVAPADPLTFAGAALLFLIVTLASS